MYLVSGCGDNKGSSTYFENYSSAVLENYSTVKGTVHTKSDRMDIVYIECNQDIDVSMEYSFNRNKGDIKVYYQSPDGTEIMIKDTSKDNGELVDSNCEFHLKQGLGKIYFMGADSTFDFNICINVSEKFIQYFDAKSPQENKSKEREYEEYEKQLA